MSLNKTDFVEINYMNVMIMMQRQSEAENLNNAVESFEFLRSMFV